MSEKHPFEEQFQTTKPQSRREWRDDQQKAPSKGGGIVEFIVILAISFALVFLVIRPFVVEAFFIPSESMVHTLEVGDRVLTNKFIYRFTEPERGDILVFKSVDGPGDLEDRKDLIKRVVGVPGDTIQVKRGKLFVNGEVQKEPYVNEETANFQAPYGPKKVPKGHIFMMGDNRGNSSDSRVFGPLPKENIEGQAFLRFWPLNRFGGL